MAIETNLKYIHLGIRTIFERFKLGIYVFTWAQFNICDCVCVFSLFVIVTKEMI